LKRKFTNIYPANEVQGYEVGDTAAQQAALGLAQRADAPTIAALSDMLTLLERVGGQFHVTAVRKQEEGQDWETVGFAFNYETRDARLVVASSPEDALSIPITDSQTPPTEVEPQQNGAEPEGIKIEAVEVDGDAKDGIQLEPEPAVAE
jgi:hypothetical protein